MHRWIRPAIGITLCVAIAVVSSAMLEGSSFSRWLPLATLVFVVLIASRFGAAAGVFGTIAAAIVFAGLLFAPKLSLRVEDTTQRSNLIWMLIAGVALSDLLGPHISGPKPKR